MHVAVYSQKYNLQCLLNTFKHCREELGITYLIYSASLDSKTLAIFRIALLVLLLQSGLYYCSTIVCIE